MKTNVLSLWVVAGFLTLIVGGSQLTRAQEQGQGALLKVLPNSKHTLAQGIHQATKGSEVPISAKFELDDNGKLSLSIYTAEKGLTTDAEHNVLKELSGSPEAATWNPETEVFKDAEHLKRSAEQLALMAISRFSLLNIVEKAQSAHRGSVFSVTPVVRNHRPEFVVLVAEQNRVVEASYDLITSAPTRATGSRQNRSIESLQSLYDLDCETV